MNKKKLEQTMQGFRGQQSNNHGGASISANSHVLRREATVP